MGLGRVRIDGACGWSRLLDLRKMMQWWADYLDRVEKKN